MFYWAIVFLFVALISGALGLAGLAVDIAIFLFSVSLVLALVLLVLGRGRSSP
ncbi:hypothetical protein [Candidatus Methylocalor cossyra]|uniref:UPF0391 membrane protein MECH1_V1_2368 n=1 Tax=Candidatus Methylocalor cossyra TaxID=3108543 RepID=A0ABM9NKI7_9GAMM